jgi:hypothetical protein
MALLDWLLHPPAGSDPDPTFDFALIGDVISIEKLSALHELASRVAIEDPDEPAEDRRQVVVEESIRVVVPAIAPVRERMTAARQTVRDVSRKLQPSTPAPADEESAETSSE